MNKDLIAYYKQRAKEYEKIYSKPERQENLKTATELLQTIFSEKKVLEIACGTGFWTEKIAQTAHSIYATDINDSVLEIARQKNYAKNNVTIGLEDIYKLPNERKHESLFGGFIWSHIKLQDLSSFFTAINNALLPESTVVFMDNNFVEGSNHPITHTDEDGNTFQTRKLENGTSHQVLKNFPTESFIQGILKGKSSEIKYIHLKYFWLLSYKTPG